MLHKNDFETNKRITQVEHLLKKNRHKGIVKRCIFLDFDGVINLFYDPDTPGYEEFCKRMENGAEWADIDCVRRFDDLVQDFDLHVIISSSWRYDGVQSCQEYLFRNGMKAIDKVIDITPSLKSGSREDEICIYLLEHPIYSDYIVLDDLPMPELGIHDIQTNLHSGYNEDCDCLARKYLNQSY